jgi:hypothetical protein
MHRACGRGRVQVGRLQLEREKIHGDGGYAVADGLQPDGDTRSQRPSPLGGSSLDGIVGAPGWGDAAKAHRNGETYPTRHARP